MRTMWDGQAVNQRRILPTIAALISAGFVGGCGASLDIMGAAPGTSPIKTGSLKKIAGSRSAKKTTAQTSLRDAIQAARAERRKGNRARSDELLKKASANFPDDPALNLERGLLAFEMGRPREAEWRIKAAIAKKDPDWRTYSALGAALAAQDRHDAAQRAFSSALRLAPNNPAVINNLAMSYALNGKIEKAESLLRDAERRAKGSKRINHIRQNLALVLGLRGQPEEARRIGSYAVSRSQALINAEYVERLRRPANVSRRSTPIKSKNRNVAKVR